ncbi:MAG: glycosyltransferase [Oscillospiraceae bacterium]|nr:glycosyltransferase [Oscillospiraceae bacterium]
MIKFSLLICVYEKENPQHFAQCIESILNQTVLPDELIIVKDGPLTNELDKIILNLNFQHDLSIISLPENMTLGPARAEGIKQAKHEWIAIMDSDDISRSDRLEKQIKMINENPELGLMGGQISEFTNQKSNKVYSRTVPTSHNDIVKYAKKRNPFNHMTVMLKRDLVISAGNYRYFPLFEDYDLWIRMIKNGVICANHPDILVDARTNNKTYGRRRGVSYINSEWRMQSQLKKIGFLNNLEFVRNLILRIPIRLLPSRIVGFIYKKTLRR